MSHDYNKPQQPLDKQQQRQGGLNEKGRDQQQQRPGQKQEQKIPGKEKGKDRF